MNTLFDKIWDAHVVQNVPDGPTQLYIDRLFVHEVTSPQAFDTLRDKHLPVFRPQRVVAMPDHNTPSDQQEVIHDPVDASKWRLWHVTARSSASATSPWAPRTTASSMWWDLKRDSHCQA